MNHTSNKAQIILVASIDAREHTRIQKLAQTYRKAGYEVHYVGMDRRSRRSKTDELDGMSCRYILRGFGYSNWRLLFGYPIWCLRLLGHSLGIHARLIHVFELDSALAIAISTMMTRVPYLYDVQDNFDLRRNWPFPLKPLIRWIDGFVLRRAAGVVVPDENRVVGPFRRVARKITVIPNCPPDVPDTASAKKPDDKLTVLAVGHLGERRGIELLLNATQGMPNVRLLMAGRFTDAQLEAKARATPQVDFRGWVTWEETIALGYQADVVFAFYDPAYQVNLLANSQKWFDAMMTGKPILSNSEIANGEWLAREDIGYLCSYGSSTKLREVLQYVALHREEAQAKGRRARLLFERKFNWPLMEQNLLGLVARATTGQSGEPSPTTISAQ